MPSGDNPNSWKYLKLGHGWNKGLSKANGDILRYGKPKSEETKQLISNSLKGIVHTLEARQKQSKTILAKFDKIGRKPIRTGHGKYYQWRKAVKERDNYTCQSCNSKEDLHSHHIKKFVDYPELRYDINNGLTLCGNCHRKTDTWGVKKSVLQKG